MTLTMRQGDVGLIRVDSIPEGAVPVEREGGALVLAFGSATGHAHAIHMGGAALFSAPNGTRFLAVREPVMLAHEEHAAITVEPGLYEIRIQREYTPEEVRNVLD